MRGSDKRKNQMPGSHDWQITDTLHDRIVLWLHSNIMKMQRAPTFMKPREQKYNMSYSSEKLTGEYDWQWKSNEVVLEQPIGSKGFADLYVLTTFCSPVTQYVDVADIEYKRQLEEVAKIESWKEREAARSLIVRPKPDFQPRQFQSDCATQALIEVKSSVNVGETVRQINYYRGDDHHGIKWFVCAPGKQYEDVFASQGIGYIPYTGPMR